MYRMIYRGQLKGAVEDSVEYIKRQVECAGRYVESGELLTMSVFKLKKDLFLYYECINKAISPEEFFTDANRFLESWPGKEQKRNWVPMMDIFHYHLPVSIENWRRKQPVEKSVGRLVCLKPDYVSSYIFYHYQRQEEMPGDGNKYGIISIHENLLFFYTEEPVIIEKPDYKGKLGTGISPMEKWGKLMNEHFIPWADVDEDQRYWRYADIICQL